MRIFDRFFRAGDSGENAPGTGLGLSIAKWAVEANGGHLTLEHSDAEGSTFRVRVPHSQKSKVKGQIAAL
jgi:signal transduction histidine kinase